AVLERLSIARYFDDVFDIVAAQLEPKPLPQIYQRFLAAHGVNPGRAAMFEDLVRNLRVPHALGMTTVLVIPSATIAGAREAWELEGRDAGDADHVTTDLGGFSHKSAALPCPLPGSWAGGARKPSQVLRSARPQWVATLRAVANDKRSCA